MRKIEIDSEIHPEHIRVYGRDCIGCQTHDQDIMIAISLNKSFDILDCFLSQREAIEFHKELGKRIKQNAEKGI